MGFLLFLILFIYFVFGLFFFFFQAEDGILDGHVTGVQTCALPICLLRAECSRALGLCHRRCAWRGRNSALTAIARFRPISESRAASRHAAMSGCGSTGNSSHGLK